MMKRRSLLMILSIVMCAAMTIGGTLAYLTDTTDTIENVFEMGDVEISITEKQLNASGAEEAFDDTGKVLSPSVSKDGQLLGGVSKIVYINNDGNTQAFVRSFAAFPEVTHTGFDFVGVNGNTNASIIVESSADVTAEVVKTGVSISDENGVSLPHTYSIVSFTANSALAAGSSVKTMTAFHMNPAITSEDLDAFYGNPVKSYEYKVLVAAQAIQTANFDGFTPANALKQGFGDATPWTVTTEPIPNPNPEPPVYDVKTAAQFVSLLEEAAASQGDATFNLDADFNMAGLSESIMINSYGGTGKLTINGNGHKLTNLNKPLFKGAFGGVDGNGSLTISNLTIEGANIAINDSTNVWGNTTLSNGMGIGVLMCYTDASSGAITLDNVKIINPTVTVSGNEDIASGVAAFVGYTSGASISLNNCTVTGGNFTGAKAVGGLIGYTQTPSAFTNCTVENTSLTSTGRPTRVGVLIGLDNAAVKATESGSTLNGNTINGAASNEKYGTVQ